LIGKIPVVGGLANKIIDHFSPNSVGPGTVGDKKGPGAVMPTQLII